MRIPLDTGRQNRKADERGFKRIKADIFQVFIWIYLRISAFICFLLFLYIVPGTWLGSATWSAFLGRRIKAVASVQKPLAEVNASWIMPPS